MLLPRQQLRLGPSVVSFSHRNLLINNDTGHQQLNKEVIICSYIVRIHLDTYCRYREDDGGPKTAALRDADTCAFKCNQGSYNINSEWPLFTPTGERGGMGGLHPELQRILTPRERLRVTGFVWTLHTSFISIFNILLLKIVVSTDMESRQSNKE